MNYYVSAVPQEFETPDDSFEFNPADMTRLFNVGYELGRQGVQQRVPTKSLAGKKDVRHRPRGQDQGRVGGPRPRVAGPAAGAQAGRGAVRPGQPDAGGRAAAAAGAAKEGPPKTEAIPAPRPAKAK